MYGPVLRGPKVTLRPPDDSDPRRFVAWLADLEVTRYLGAFVKPPSLEQEQEWFERIGEAKDHVYWIVEAEGRAVGGTMIGPIDWVNEHGHTGTLIGDKTAWRKGYATEAISLRTEYAFRQLNLHKLTTGAFVENEPSKRALARSGYREVGVEREHFWRDGRWHDHWLGEVLREEWERS